MILTNDRSAPACFPAACEMPRSHAGAATASGRGGRLLWHEETQSSARAEQDRDHRGVFLDVRRDYCACLVFIFVICSLRTTVKEYCAPSIPQQ